MAIPPRLESCQYSMEDKQEQYIAATQRQRTLLFYKACIQSLLTLDRVVLRDGTQLTAEKLIAVDSSESKLVLKGLRTDWGRAAIPVTIRGSDLVAIEVNGHSDTRAS
jgi:hypothetical protein